VGGLSWITYPENLLPRANSGKFVKSFEKFAKPEHSRREPEDLKSIGGSQQTARFLADSWTGCNTWQSPPELPARGRCCGVQPEHRRSGHRARLAMRKDIKRTSCEVPGRSEGTFVGEAAAAGPGRTPTSARGPPLGVVRVARIWPAFSLRGFSFDSRQAFPLWPCGGPLRGLSCPSERAAALSFRQNSSSGQSMRVRPKRFSTPFGNGA